MTATTLAAPATQTVPTWRRALHLVPVNLSGRAFLAGYAVLGTAVAMFLTNYISPLFEDASDNSIISLGSTLLAAPVLAAALIPARNYARTLNLGASRADFYVGTLLTVGVLSLGAGVVAQILHHTLDAWMAGQVESVMGVAEAMGHYDVPALGWLATATTVAVMALMVQAVVLVQTRWATRPSVLVPIDVALVAALVVTLVVPPLRSGLRSVFWWTMSGPNPFVQIPLGLAAAAALALLGWVLLRRRTY
jgi:hypothetical protein